MICTKRVKTPYNPMIPYFNKCKKSKPLQLKRFVPLLLLTVQTIFGAGRTLQGVVADGNTKEPLVGAEVYLQHRMTGTITDRDGYFHLVLPANDLTKQDTLIVSYIGYQTYKIPALEFKNKKTVYLQPKSLQLGEAIQVYAERLDLARQEIPHSKEEINVDELTRYGTSEISDLFKRMASVRVEGNDLDGRRVQIRGSNASEVNVYLDGVLINGLSPDYTADLTIIPTENIYKLEVLKGSNLPLLGSGAFGGVLNILSRQDMESRVMLKYKAGSFDSRYYIGSFNVPIKNTVFVSYFGQYNQMRPEIEFFSEERFQEKTRAEFVESKKMNHNFNLDYLFNGGQIRAKIFNYRFDYTKPYWQNKRNNMLYALTVNTESDWNGVLSIMNGNDEIKRYIIESNKYISEFESQSMTLKLSKKIDFRTSSLQITADYFHDELTRFARQEIGGDTYTYNQADLYNNRAGLSGIFSFDDRADTLRNLRWKTFISMRGDLSANGYRDLTYTLGAEIVWQKNNWELKPYLNYGTNVKYPTLLESAYAGNLRHALGRPDTSLSELQPEYNTSSELGARFTLAFNHPLVNRLQASLALFRNLTYNKILKRPEGDQIYQTQIGQNTNFGLEAAARFTGLLKYFDFSASLTKLDISNPLFYEYKPELNYNFQLDYVSRFGLYVTAVYFYEGKSYAWYFDLTRKSSGNDEEGAPPQPLTRVISPFADVDVSLGYRFKIAALHLNLQIAGYNILDNAGFKYYYLKKQYFQASLSVQY